MSMTSHHIARNRGSVTVKPSHGGSGEQAFAPTTRALHAAANRATLRAFSGTGAAAGTP